MADIEQLERQLWEAADQLRSNSKLTSTEYSMPVLGLIFLRHAYNRFLVVEKEITASLPIRAGVARPITKDDFVRKNAMFLREEAKYDYLLHTNEDKATAANRAMEIIEDDYPQLKGVLPKDYHLFGNDLMKRLLRIFHHDSLINAGGDVFGRIYEYFLMKFAMSGAQDSGEFFTPVSLVQMIVSIIEPDHGIVADVACGSCGMFVQTNHFLELTGKHAGQAVTFYGQEKTATTIRLAKMNLTVHGLEGKIAEANTFYQDSFNLCGKCDFMMANPPFNVDGVDAEKIKADPRLPFGLPGVNSKKEVSNGNYLWISYFYSYLNAAGRAGFVMSSQASSAGNKEKEVRRKIIETGHVDVMISIRSNFFYTRSVPCELWFFNKNKPAPLKDKVLMLDARNVYRQVTRKIYDFAPEQLRNLTAIVWLYRGEQHKYLALMADYIARIRSLLDQMPQALIEYQQLLPPPDEQPAFLRSIDIIDKQLKEQFSELKLAAQKAQLSYKNEIEELTRQIRIWLDAWKETDTVKSQAGAAEAVQPIRRLLKQLGKTIPKLARDYIALVEFADKELKAASLPNWDKRAMANLKKELDEKRQVALDRINDARDSIRYMDWLFSRFPEAELVDVPGLVKLVDRAEIADNDWSLTPGRYVGVAPVEEDEEFDFESIISQIHEDLSKLNNEAFNLGKLIDKNYADLLK